MFYKSCKSITCFAFISAALLALTVFSGAQDAPQSESQNERLIVKKATYGATDGSEVKDVTERLRAVMKNGRLLINVDNGALRGDPAPGKPKKLSVEYSLDGKDNKVEVEESKALSLRSKPKGVAQSGPLIIKKAVYGAVDGSKEEDVTETVIAAVQNGKLSIGVVSDALGGDPAPGKPKKLSVEYSLDGKENKIEVPEFKTLSLDSGAL